MADQARRLVHAAVSVEVAAFAAAAAEESGEEKEEEEGEKEEEEEEGEEEEEQGGELEDAAGEEADEEAWAREGRRARPLEEPAATFSLRPSAVSFSSTMWRVRSYADLAAAAAAASADAAAAHNVAAPAVLTTSTSYSEWIPLPPPGRWNPLPPPPPQPPPLPPLPPPPPPPLPHVPPPPPPPPPLLSPRLHDDNVAAPPVLATSFNAEAPAAVLATSFPATLFDAAEPAVPATSVNAAASAVLTAFIQLLRDGDPAAGPDRCYPSRHRTSTRVLDSRDFS